MPVYRLEIAPEAAKVLAELPAHVAAELSDRLDELPVLLELTGADGVLSGRARTVIREHHAIYTFDRTEHRVRVEQIVHPAAARK